MPWGISSYEIDLVIFIANTIIIKDPDQIILLRLITAKCQKTEDAQLQPTSDCCENNYQFNVLYV